MSPVYLGFELIVIHSYIASVTCGVQGKYKG